MPQHPQLSGQGRKNGAVQAPSEFTLGFERIVQALGLASQSDLAITLDIRQSSISDAKRRGVIPGEWALKLYRNFGLNPRWVYDGLPPVFLTKPSPSGPEDAGWDQPAAESSFLLRYQPESLLAMRVEDASMEPLIHRDAYVGVNTRDKTPVDGGLFGLMLPMEGFCVRRLRQENRKPLVLVTADNASIKAQHLATDALAGAMLGRVVWVMHRP
ncbi:LexA family transcriptional regulator [Fundidesulfovibrio agrisoli]|uniref:LexA family transcriptional regulator n=1 Tax=Fundidesulfovibrio agrisoli TaxID=2922717 RepID=UPI001FAE19CB|nr:LexA family transcriptional regulator [Fundidesulfovibrio agrisoli]